MFEGYKYRGAKNATLMLLADKKLISSELSIEMREIAYKQPNREFGVSLLKSGTCNNKFEAATSVFARLGIVAEETQSFSPGELEWDMACREALILGGASYAHAFTHVDELKEIIKTAHYGA